VFAEYVNADKTLTLTSNLKPNPIYALYGSHFNKWVSAHKISS